MEIRFLLSSCTRNTIVNEYLCKLRVVEFQMSLYMSRSILLTILILLVSGSAAKAQVGITAVPFLEINHDVRSVGIGGATVALNHSRGGLHLNPATFGMPNTIEFSSQFNREGSISLLGSSWLPNYNIDDSYLYTPQLIVGFNKLSVGYQFTYFNLGEQSVTSENDPDVIDTFNSYEYAHTLSFSYAASKYLSLGMGLSYVKSSLATGIIVSEYEVDAADAMTLDFGVYADNTFEFDFIDITPSIGWSLTDFGYPVGYTGESNKDPLPIMMRGGLGLRVDLMARESGLSVMSIGVYGSLEKIMARTEEVITDRGGGITDTSYAAVGPFRALIDSWKPYEHFNGQEYVELSVFDQFRRRSGIEITVLEILSFRMGHFYEHPDNGAREYDTDGFGISYKYFSFDFAEYVAMEPDHPLEGTKFWQFGLNLPLELLTRE